MQNTKQQNKKQFEDDLKFGELWEKKYILIKHLQPNEYKKMEGKFKEYDFEIYDVINYTVEIKTDRMTHFTNNICIEYESFFQNSGIETTTADIWIYFVVKPNNKFDMYEIPVPILKQLIQLRRYQRTVKDYQGNSKSYLFNSNVFERYLTFKDKDNIYNIE